VCGISARRWHKSDSTHCSAVKFQRAFSAFCSGEIHTGGEALKQAEYYGFIDNLPLQGIAVNNTPLHRTNK
jgi:hypothetical protein